MVERFHSQLKAAIMAHKSPAVLLVIRSAVKILLGRSAAEMIDGTTLRLPGEFTEQYTVDARTDLDNYSDTLRVAMLRLRLCPPRDTPQRHFPIQGTQNMLACIFATHHNSTTHDSPI